MNIRYAIRTNGIDECKDFDTFKTENTSKRIEINYFTGIDNLGKWWYTPSSEIYTDENCYFIFERS